MRARQEDITLFVLIARQHLAKASAADEKLQIIEQQAHELVGDGAPDEEYGHEFLSLGGLTALQERDESAVITIVFAAMALDAFIYDYGATNLSDSFVRKYLDKLDLAGKWVLVPHLVTGREFPKDRRGFELLRELVKARNNLVHSKSSEIDLTDEASLARAEKEANKWLSQAKNAILCLDEIAVDLDSIHPAAHATFHLGERPKTE